MTSYADALTFATIAHLGQVRKGTSVPYITHPVAVSALVGRHGGDEALMIAALLHDVLEDCPDVQAGEIAQTFGTRILAIVEACTDGVAGPDGRKPSWRERKVAYLAHLAGAPDDVILVSACDKLHNASCIVEDLGGGIDVFERFTAGREGTLWYYASLARVLRERLVDRPMLSGALTAQVAAMIRLGAAEKAA